MLLEEVMRRSFPWLPKEAWPNCANLNLYTEAWQSVGANLRISPVNFKFWDQRWGNRVALEV